MDDFSFSGGPPIRLSLEGLALPADSSFKTTQRTLTYEDATLQEIGQEIAGRAGIALFYEADTISIKRIEQTNQSDCEFYNKLVTDYGLVLKIYDNRLVVFSEAQYEAKAAKLTLTEADFEPGWSWDTTLEGTYTGIKYQYTNADQNKTFTVEAGGGNRIKTSNTAADNLSEAITIALAELNTANKGTTTMSITLKAQLGLIASDCVEIKGLQKLDGKYYIEKITHSIGSGYKMTLEMRRVEERITTVNRGKRERRIGRQERGRPMDKQQLLRIGRISSYNFPDGTARVTYDDKDGSTTPEIPFLAWEHWRPKIGDQVLVGHLSNGTSRAIILGPFWYEGHRPHGGRRASTARSTRAPWVGTLQSTTKRPPP